MNRTETIIKSIRDTIDPMIGHTFVYNGNTYFFKKYIIHTDRERVFIETKTKDFDRPFESVIDFVKGFSAVTNGHHVPHAPAVPGVTFAPVDAGDHQQSRIHVYETRDYSRFSFLNGNRTINDRKVNKIITEIQGGNDMLCYYPIQVKDGDGRLEILDGQHRFYISKKLKRPVFYILVQEAKSMPDIAKINSNVDKWKSDDFINCYVQHGNENYKILRNFIRDYHTSLTVSLQLLQSGNPGSDHMCGSQTEDFKNGVFKVNKYEEAEAHVKDCLLFNTFSNCRSRSFIIAVYRIKKAGLITIDELLTAYHKRPEMLTEQANYKAYVNTLEQIVNVGKQKRIVII